MYEFPSDGQKAFLVNIYNKDVRAAVKENRSHTKYRDEWADVQVHEVSAADEKEARARMQKRYRPENGFVIESVLPELS